MDHFLGRNDDKMQCRGILHIVKAGDTLYKIGKMHGVPVSRIMYANPYVDIYNLQIGDEICVPVMMPRTQTGGAYPDSPMAPARQPMDSATPAPMNQGFPAPAPAPMNQGFPAPAPAPMNQGFPAPMPAPMNQGFPAPMPAPMNQGYPGNIPETMDGNAPEDWTTPVRNRNASTNGTAPMPGNTMGNEAAPMSGNTMGNEMMSMPDGTMGNEAALMPDGTMGNEAALMPDETMGNEAVPMYGGSMGRSAMQMHTVQEEAWKHEPFNTAGNGMMQEAVPGGCMGSRDNLPDAAYAGNTEDMEQGRMEQQPEDGRIAAEECGAVNGGVSSCQAYARRQEPKAMPWENTAVTDGMMHEYLNVTR